MEKRWMSYQEAKARKKLMEQKSIKWIQQGFQFKGDTMPDDFLSKVKPTEPVGWIRTIKGSIIKWIKE